MRPPRRGLGRPARWTSLLAAVTLALLIGGLPAVAAPTTAAGPAAASAADPVSPTTTTRGTTWVGGAVMNPARGGPVDVSCPTSTWCMSVDINGDSLVLDGTRWTNRQHVPERSESRLEFRAVSCPTTSWCLATMFSKRLAVWSGGTWRLVDVDEIYEDVSCWQVDGCGLTMDPGYGAGADFARWTGGAVTSKVFVPNRAGAMDVSCPTATCYFLTATGTPRTLYVHRITGSTTFSTTRVGASPNYDSEDVSCSSSTSCMVAFDRSFRTLSGSTWSAVREIDDTVGRSVTTMDVSCPSAGSCTVVGYADGVWAQRWNGRAWTSSRLGVGANTARAIDCPTTTTCTVVDERGRFNRWNGRTWSARARFDDARGGLNALECPTSGLCVATDLYGNVMEWSPSRGWSWNVLSENGATLDCTGSFCMAVDWLENWRRARTSAGWQPANTESTVWKAMACASSSRCFAPILDQVTRFGQTWETEPQRLPVDLGNNYLAGDCPSSTFCLFIGSNGRSVSWNGTRWTSRGRVPGEAGGPPDVDCLSASYCVASFGGATSSLTGSGWKRLGTFSSVSVSCRATAWCAGLGADGELFIWNGRSWADSGHRFGGDDYSDELVRCVAGSRCMVVADGRAWWTP